MPLKVLVIPDKFKGTLTTQAAAFAIARGWRAARPDDEIELLPMSDGGDGFGEVVCELLGAKPQTLWSVDAARRRCQARWWWEAKSKTAIIESAGIIGLAKLPPKKFHPFELDTYGMAGVIGAAAAKGAKQCLIGIGGSATNDGGFGLAYALGWRFQDRDGKPIETWTRLSALSQIRPPERKRWFTKLIVAVDVHNPLLGARGATRVYGPQKGLKPAHVRRAEVCLRQLARVVKRTLRRDFSKIPGAGAAGGLGFGLMAFLGAKPEAGFDLFMRLAKLKTQLRSADLVITGEGTIDKSTLMGKGVGEIARRCRQLKVPCIGLAGVVNDSDLIKGRFTATHGLTEVTAVREAKARPEFWLERLTMRTACQWS